MSGVLGSGAGRNDPPVRSRARNRSGMGRGSRGREGVAGSGGGPSGTCWRCSCSSRGPGPSAIDVFSSSQSRSMTPLRLWSWVSGVRVPSLTPSKMQVRSPGQDYGRGSRRFSVRFWEQVGSRSWVRAPMTTALPCPRRPPTQMAGRTSGMTSLKLLHPKRRAIHAARDPWSGWQSPARDVRRRQQRRRRPGT